MRSDRASVDRKMFQALVAKNQELVKRCQKLLGKLNSLRDINKDLQEKLDLAEQKLNSLGESWRRSSGGDDTMLSPRRIVLSRCSPWGILQSQTK